MAVGLLEALIRGYGPNVTEEERLARLRLGGEDTPAGGVAVPRQGLLAMAGGQQPQMAAPAPAAPAPAPSQTPQPPMPQGGEGGGILAGIGGLLNGVLGGRKQGGNASIQFLMSKGYSPEAAQVIARNKDMLGRAIVETGSPQGANEYAKRQQAMQAMGIDMNSEEGKRYFLTGNLPSDNETETWRDMTPQEVQAAGLPMGVYQKSNKGKITTVGGVRDQTAGFSNEKDLASQYSSDPNVKEYAIVRNNYERIREGAQMGSGAGDIAIIFGYMKMLDPTSVVRENEQATAENAGGVPDQVRNYWNKLLAGDKLPPNVRQMYVESAGKLYEQVSKNVQDVNTRFGNRSKAWGVDPTHFQVNPEVYDPLNVGGPDPAGAVAPGPSGGTQTPMSTAPQPGTVEGGYRFKGGNPADPNAWEPVQ